MHIDQARLETKRVSLRMELSIVMGVPLSRYHPFLKRMDFQ